MASAVAVALYLQKQHLWGDTQLQKLVFYAQAWTLAWTGKPLFDDAIEAWKLGPVTPAVWYSTKHGDPESAPQDLSDEERKLVDAVYAYYGKLGGLNLSAMTHTEAPWKDAWNEGRGQNSVISHAAMRRAYVEQALREPDMAPKAPVITTEPAATDVKRAVERQRKRWRPLLDRLANQ